MIKHCLHCMFDNLPHICKIQKIAFLLLHCNILSVTDKIVSYKQLFRDVGMKKTDLIAWLLIHTQTQHQVIYLLENYYYSISYQYIYIFHM